MSSSLSSGGKLNLERYHELKQKKKMKDSPTRKASTLNDDATILKASTRVNSSSFQTPEASPSTTSNRTTSLPSPPPSRSNDSEDKNLVSTPAALDRRSRRDRRLSQKRHLLGNRGSSFAYTPTRLEKERENDSEKKNDFSSTPSFDRNESLVGKQEMGVTPPTTRRLTTKANSAISTRATEKKDKTPATEIIATHSQISKDRLKHAPPRTWDHNQLVAFLQSKTLFHDIATLVPKDMNGRTIFRLTIPELQQTFYAKDEKGYGQAEKLYRSLRAESDRLARLDLKQRVRCSIAKREQNL
jgi:hypothetical protein